MMVISAALKKFDNCYRPTHQQCLLSSMFSSKVLLVIGLVHVRKLLTWKHHLWMSYTSILRNQSQMNSELAVVSDILV